MWNLSSWDILRVSALSIIRLVKYLSLENDFTRQISLWEAEIIFGLRWMVWDIRNAEFFNQLRYLKGLPTSDKQINPNNISSLSVFDRFMRAPHRLWPLMTWKSQIRSLNVQKRSGTLDAQKRWPVRNVHTVQDKRS